MEEKNDKWCSCTRLREAEKKADTMADMLTNVAMWTRIAESDYPPARYGIEVPPSDLTSIWLDIGDCLKSCGYDAVELIGMEEA